MKRTFRFVLVSLVLVLSIEAQKAPPPPPKALASKEKAARMVGLTIEKYVSNYDVNADGTVNQVWELQQKCISEACFDRVRQLKHIFNGDLQNVRLIDAYVVKANGTKIAVPLNAAKIRPTPQAEAAPGFSSLREFELAYNILKLGDSAYYKLQIDTRKAVFERNFNSLELFPSIFEWKSVEINVTAPTDYTLFTEVIGLDGGRLDDVKGRARWQWRKSGLAATEVEPMMMDAYGRSPRFAITSFRSYDELGKAFWAGVKEKAVITPEIQALASEITKDVTGREEQAAAIYRWVNKNIRYLSVVLDRGGWVPHSSTEILQNRYGDCKDYTTIIYTLLKAKGIESVPLLIRAEPGSWFPGVASAPYFNHAILYVPEMKAFADATAPNTRLGLIPQFLVGKKAVLAGEKTGVIEIPQNIPDDNQMLSDVEINIGDTGELKAVSQNTYVGRSEMIFRPLFGESDLVRNSDTFVKLILAYSGLQGSGKMLEISDPSKVHDPFMLKMEVDLPSFVNFATKGRLSLPIGINLINPSQLGAFALEEKRETDLLIGASRIREKFRITLPEHVKIGNLPQPTSLENAAGIYKYSFTTEGSKIVVLREIVLTKDVITPTEYPAFKELVKASQDDLYKDIEYTVDPKVLQTKSKTVKPAPPRKIESTEEILLSTIPFFGPKLSAPEVRRLETAVVADPQNADARSRLLIHYENYSVRKTPATEKARLGHWLWFIKNKPDMDSLTVYRWSLAVDDKESIEYKTLRDEWLKQVDSRKADGNVRVNAATFVRDKEPDVAKKLVIEGMSLDPERFEFPSMLTEIYLDEYKKSRSGGKPDFTLGETILDTGTKALSALKADRSGTRDSKRTELLIGMSPIALDAERFDLAESFGRELVVTFGDDITDADFQTGTHVGNITLGRVELARGNTSKAAEHLLISMRAPLRRDEGYFNDFDLTLAKELYKKGETKAVADYFRLCLELGAFKTDAVVHQKKMRTIRAWITAIEKGSEPTFDLSK